MVASKNKFVNGLIIYGFPLHEYKGGIKLEKTNYTYYKIENNIPMEIKNTANMQLIKINLFQNNLINPLKKSLSLQKEE
jgi:hypothetical protein